MNLGDELKEANRKKQEKQERDAEKRKQKQLIEAAKEAEERFPKIVKGLEDRIREANKKGEKSIELLWGYPGKYKLSEADWKIYFKLQTWAKERGLRTYSIDYKRDFDGYDTYPSAGITWEEPRPYRPIW